MRSHLCLFSEPNFLHELNLNVSNTVMVMSSNCMKVIIFVNVARICNCLEWNLLKRFWRQMVMSLGLSAMETFSRLCINQLQLYNQ